MLTFRGGQASAVLTFWDCFKDAYVLLLFPVSVRRHVIFDKSDDSSQICSAIPRSGGWCPDAGGGSIAWRAGSLPVFVSLRLSPFRSLSLVLPLFLLPLTDDRARRRD